MKLEDIISALPKLKAEEVQKVRMTCDFLLQGKPEITIRLDSPSVALEFFYEAALSHCAKKGLTWPPFRAFRRLDVFKAYQANWPLVESFIQKNWPNAKLNDRHKLYGLFVELLADSIISWDVPLTIGTFCRNMGKLPQLVTDAFPGYAEQGWLSLILEWGDRNGCTEG